MNNQLIDIIETSNPWLLDSAAPIATNDGYIPRQQMAKLLLPEWDTVWLVLVGPRQAGKTTLGKHICQQLIHTERRFAALLYLNCDYLEVRQWLKTPAFIKEAQQQFSLAKPIIFIDEAHHARGDEMGGDVEDLSSMYATLIDFLDRRLKNKGEKLRVISGSGTPDRGDELSLHPRIENGFRYDVSYEEVHMAGRTVPANTEIVDYELKDSSETSKKLLERLTNNPLVLNDTSRIRKELKNHRPDNFIDVAADNFVKNSKGSRSLVFCETISQCEDYLEALKKRGVKAAVIHSKASKEHNEKANEEYQNGDNEALISVDMISEGYNVPDTDHVHILSRSLTKARFDQVTGRASRNPRDQINKMFAKISKSKRDEKLIGN